MNTDPLILKDNTTYSYKNGVVTEYVKPEATPQAQPPPMVSSSAWVEELAERWARRLAQLQYDEEHKEIDKYGLGQLHELEWCLKELRAGAKSSSTTGRTEMPIPAQKGN